MASNVQDDAVSITTDVLRLGRAVNHPRVFERLTKESGAQLDKVSEITMNCLGDGSEMRLSDIAARLGVELSSVSRKVAKLEEAGYLERRPDPDDARASRMLLTTAGATELQKLLDVRVSSVQRALEEWTPDERHHFRELLARFLNDLTQGDQP